MKLTRRKHSLDPLLALLGAAKSPTNNTVIAEGKAPSEGSEGGLGLENALAEALCSSQALYMMCVKPVHVQYIATSIR